MRALFSFLLLAIVTAAFAISPISGGGGAGGGTIPSVTNLINGDGAGNGADSGIAPANVLQLGGAAGTPSGITLTNGTGLPESGVTNLTTDLAAKAPLASPVFTGHPTIEGVTSTGATGTGKVIYDTSPTINTPVVKHFISTGGIGSLTPVAGTWTTETMVGTDTCGVLTLTPSGTGPTSTTICTIAYGTAYGSAPNVVLIASNASAIGTQGGAKAVTATTTSSTITLTAGSTGLVSGTVYQWIYLVVQ